MWPCQSCRRTAGACRSGTAMAAFNSVGPGKAGSCGARAVSAWMPMPRPFDKMAAWSRCGIVTARSSSAGASPAPSRLSRGASNPRATAACPRPACLPPDVSPSALGAHRLEPSIDIVAPPVLGSAAPSRPQSTRCRPSEGPLWRGNDDRPRPMADLSSIRVTQAHRCDPLGAAWTRIWRHGSRGSSPRST